jgi:hypothetical protein
VPPLLLTGSGNCIAWAWQFRGSDGGAVALPPVLVQIARVIR